MQQNRPSNDYDVQAWLDFYAANPGMHRSVGADGDGNEDTADGDTTGNTDGASDSDGSSGDDWRSAFAGGDEKRLTQLQRFTKPEDFASSYFDAQAKITSGELLKPLPQDATEEDVKRYREQLGIPQEAKGYFEQLPEGLVIGDEDLPIFESLGEALLDVNAPPEVMHKTAEWYNKFIEESAAAQQEADEKLADEVEAQFRDEWQGDYRRNINAINAFVERTFGEHAEDFVGSRTADGTPMLSNPAILKGLIDMARELNPAALIVENSGDPNQSIDDEIKKLEGMMGDRGSEYWRGPKAEDNQKRYRQLLDARSSREKRGQAA